MSRKKDRERFLAAKASDPNYKGFRGAGAGASNSSEAATVPVTCSICGRKRNIPAAEAEAAGDKYVCDSCREQQAAAAGAQPEGAAAPGESAVAEKPAEPPLPEQR